MTSLTIFVIIIAIYTLISIVSAILFLKDGDHDLKTKITFLVNLTSPIFILGAILIAKFAASDL